MLMETDYHIRLQRSFYLQDPFSVAKKVLLGAYLCSEFNGILCAGKITEVEVYPGGEDKASHTYMNRRTLRTEPVFNIGGHAYIFLVYGAHHQFCVVTGQKNEPCAILIRSLEPVAGLEEMKRRRHTQNMRDLTTGPGKLCQALNITRTLTGSDLMTGPIWICPHSETLKPCHILSLPRIGVDYAGAYAHKKWRFILKDNKFISK
ncbi:MAG: DNA-3-methyladenine glycosylase [Alphaproteobacteria bacterium]